MEKSVGWAILGISVVFVGGIVGAYLVGTKQAKPSAARNPSASRPKIEPQQSPPPAQPLQSQPLSQQPLSQQQPEPVEQAPTLDQVWVKFVDSIRKEPHARVRAEFTGGGSEQTGYFTVQSSHQLILWMVDPEQTVPTLIVEVRDGSNRHVDQFIPDAKTKFYGGSQLRLPPGSYYFNVTSFGSWRLGVVEDED